jgi:hypothetical protein
MMVEYAESTLVVQPGQTYLGCGSSQSVECLCEKTARNALGKLSAESVEASVAGALLNDVLCQELGVESAQPGRLSAHHAGAVLPAADAIDWDSVWTIAQGIEAAYEIIRFSLPGREDEIFWSEVTFGARSGWRAFRSVDDVLVWLPQSVEDIPTRIISTQSLGLRSSRAFSEIPLAQLQDKRIRASP